MATLLKGGAVADAMSQEIMMQLAKLATNGLVPTLGILRVGQQASDIAYENAAAKRCEKLGLGVRRLALAQNTSQEALQKQIKLLNADESIHGILLLRPLPAGMNEDEVRNSLCAQKDVDGVCDASLAAVFTGQGSGFAPCTAQACMQLLKHYKIPLSGKNAVVIGRSLVVGKPLAMLLLASHATVTLCHTRTQNLPAICRSADIVIACAGQAQMLNAEYFAPGQTVLDVGIHLAEGGKLCGDVNFNQAQGMVAAITPVPGGVGSVTTTVLAGNVVAAAMRQSNN